MLTLNRKEGESIIIHHGDDQILITITDAKKGKVKVNLEGPKVFEVVREELLEQ